MVNRKSRVLGDHETIWPYASIFGVVTLHTRKVQQPIEGPAGESVFKPPRPLPRPHHDVPIVARVERLKRRECGHREHRLERRRPIPQRSCASTERESRVDEGKKWRSDWQPPFGPERWR